MRKRRKNRQRQTEASEVGQVRTYVQTPGRRGTPIGSEQSVPVARKRSVPEARCVSSTRECACRRHGACQRHGLNQPWWAEKGDGR